MARTAIYPGSFDPVTNGHLDIIRRAAALFDTLVVAVGRAPDKKERFSVEERMEMIRACTAGMDNVEVDSFSGLLVEYARRKGCGVVVRSLRAVSDFEHEFQMVVLNKQMHADLETVFLMTDKDYFYLSSTAVKEIASKGGDVSGLVPEGVATKLKGKRP